MRRASALCVFLVACSSAPGATGAPTAEELVASLPHLKGDDPSFETLLIRGRDYAGEYMDVRMELYIRRPDDYAVYVFDVRDDTPIIIVSGGKGYIYDAKEGVLHWADPAEPMFTIGAEDGQYRVGWGIDHEDPPRPDISIDLPSIAAMAPDRIVKKTGADQFRLVSKSPRGGTLTIDFAGIGPYWPTRLVMRPKDLTTDTMTRLDTIAINGTIPDDAFIQLDRERWAKAAPLEDLRRKGARPLTWLGFGTSLVFRGQFRKLEGSQEFAGTVFDWDKLREQDARISAELRSAYAQAKARSGSK